MTDTTDWLARVLWMSYTMAQGFPSQLSPWESMADKDTWRAMARAAVKEMEALPDSYNLKQALLASTVSCSGLTIRIACGDHDVKDLLMDCLTMERTLAVTNGVRNDG